MPCSVIIPSLLMHPACNESFASVMLAAKRAPGSEVIIVANGDGPRPETVVPKDARVITSDVGGSAARNAGLRAARHRRVLFTDDDCRVPGNWCQELIAALDRTGAAAVAGAVDVPAVGPVTAYLDYQRSWDAAPADGVTALYVVTANCAIDRAQAPLFFDETLAECMDLDFGYRIRDNGGTIAWVDSPAVTHLVPESIAELVRRYLIWGHSIARLHLAGRPLDDPNYVLQSYTELCAGEPGYNRRFRELASVAQRSAFTAAHLAFLGSYQAGYLDGLGQSLVHIDEPALIHAWTTLMTRFASWSVPEVDLSRLNEPCPPSPLHTEVGQLLSEHAPLTGAIPTLPADTSGSEDWQQTAKTVATFKDLVHLGTTVNDLRRHMRQSGIPFALGMAMLEGALDPAAADWFASVTE